MDATGGPRTGRRPGSTPESGLATTLGSRHVSMIAFGGTIGAGIFVGSGTTIAQAGPAVVLSYVVVGVLAAVVMRILGVLTSHNPDSGAFATHAGAAFGHIGRFAVGWMYWWLMVVTASVECGAASSIAHTWLPSMPAWGWALMFTVTLTAVNLAPVRVFGEFQFWLALWKVILAVAVPVIAVLGVLGVLPGVQSPGTANIVNFGGFLPKGSGVVVAGMLVAAFSFLGVEMAAIAAGEADRPRRVIRGAMRIVVYTVLGCYVLALLMTVLLVPWNDPRVAASPFGAMMTALHLPATATVINIVVFTAVLSVLNSCIYSASRIGYALAGRTDAPKSWRRLSPRRVPVWAVCWAAVFGFAVTLLSEFAPGNISTAVIDSAGAVGIMTWIAIALSYLKLRPKTDSWRPRSDATQRRRMVFSASVAAAALTGLLVGMVFLPSTQLQLVMTMVPAIVIFAVVLWRETNVSAEPDP